MYRQGVVALLVRFQPQTGQRLSHFHGSGHAINLEEPQWFNQFLAEFLAQVEQGRDFVRPEATRPESIWGPSGDPRK